MDSIRDGGERSAFGLFGVDAAHAGRPILRDVTLTLRPGEFHALIGGRNSGKSAISSALSGDLPITGGRVRLSGRDYQSVSPRLARRNGVCCVSVSPNVFPRLNVAESLISGESSWLRSLRPWRRYLRDMRQWLAKCGIELPLHRTLEFLPKEDWVFVEIVARLYRSPKVLILDEALERLSQERRRTLLPLLRERMDAGMSVLWITHKIEDVLGTADWVSVVREGKILLSSRAHGLEHLNLIQLCYTHLEETDGIGVTMQQFRQLMRFTGALVRDLPQAVAILDTEGIARFVNRSAQKLFSVGNGDPGQGVEALLGGGNAELAAKIAAAARNGVDEVWHNVVFRHKGGNTLSDVTLRRMEEHGNAVGYMLQIEDVSAREALRRRVILSENLASVGLLAAGVAHEVNNPLEILGNYLVFLKKREDDPEARRALLKIEEEAARIQQIVNNLVVFSGDVGVDDSTADLYGLCLDLCDLLKFHHKDRRISFSCPRIDFAAVVPADPNEMRQVLLNLFKNSIAAIGDGGRIAISFSRIEGKDGPLVEMRFSDNGPGIRLDKPEDVFLPFVTTRAEGGKNHGLGLFIVYGIVEKYGGSIHVENASEGGCVFTITLPAVPAP